MNKNINNFESISYEPLPTTLKEVLEIPKKKKIIYLKNYWKTLLLIAIFYAVPSIQFVIIQYNEDSNQCYYNLKCAHEYLGIKAFNNVISNLGYIICGFSFLLLVRIQDKEVEEENENENELKGLPKDYSLYYTLGWSTVFEGIFSALYHICPSRMNFQFDTTFMIIGSGLLFITLYSKRQPTLISGPFKIFGFFALIILLNIAALANIKTWIFWSLVIVLFSYISLAGSIHLYYYEKLVLDMEHFGRFFHRILYPSKPRDKLRFFFILFGNLINYGFSIESVLQGFKNTATQDFPTIILTIINIDLLLYIIYYIIMKYKNGEKVFLTIWIMGALMILFWALALYFYTIPLSNKFLTPEESKKLNKPCVLFNFFDYHDIWHFLSAFGVTLFFIVVDWLDLDIRNKPRNEIKIF
jgi:hypothetical protein